MLRADLVVAADDPTLEEGPDVLHRVRVDVGSDVFMGGVVDDLVPSVLVPDALIADPFVGVDGLRLVGHALTDEALEGSLGPVADDAQTDLSAAFGGSDDRRVILVAVVSATGSDTATTDERLVNFHDPAQERLVVVPHSGADAMREVPGRLVGHGERPAELPSRHALLRLGEQIDGEEPLPKRQVG